MAEQSRVIAVTTGLGRTLSRVVPAAMPNVFAFTTFLAGVVLLVSGATPETRDRLTWLNYFLPLPVVEVSAYFESVAGVCLLLLARGLQRRLDAAYHLTVFVLGGGIVFALASAFDYIQAMFLGLMLVALVPSRRHFYRKASLIEERFTTGWIVAIAIAVSSAIYLGLVMHLVPTFSGEMFWQFAANAQAPRFLRATTLTLVVLLVFAIARLLRHARVVIPPADTSELARVEPIINASSNASAHLALLGDKSILLSDSGNAFIMYRVAGRSWVALGDPVGENSEMVALIQRFVELAYRHGGWPIFYRAGPTLLYLYLEHGLSVVKLGEQARVPMAKFSLEGSQRRNLRRVWRNAIDDGCSFEVIEPARLPSILPELRTISDAWLANKGTREKSFSLGAFDESYISRFSVGIVRKAGNIVAFAVVWTSGRYEEVAVDLMRYNSHAPSGIMRYLLIEYMLWAKDQGYQWFNLGMAPLSGLRTSAFTPLWNQFVNTVRDVGEPFYNFQGLRNFKAWFYPEWEPRYLVSPGGTKRPIIVANIATLIAGSAAGIVRK
jgi:phosphatidylglycerol lysyltransferase